MVSAFDRFVSNVSFNELSQFVFLAGSGVSVPSGPPSGWEFNSRLAEFLSASAAETQELQSLRNP